MYKGYYTFSNLQNLLGDNGVDITPVSRSGHYILKTNSSTILNISSHQAWLLGFNDNNRTFMPNTEVISDNIVDINLGLNYVSVCCNLVNENFCVDANGKRSDIITTLPVTTAQTFFGSATRFVDIESKAPVTKGWLNQLQFRITHQNSE